MPKAYLEPEHLNALVEIFHEAKRILERDDCHAHPVILEAVARRILELAYEGMPPWLILNEIIPPMSPEDAGLSTSGETIDLSRNDSSRISP